VHIFIFFMKSIVTYLMKCMFYGHLGDVLPDNYNNRPTNRKNHTVITYASLYTVFSAVLSPDMRLDVLRGEN